MQTLGQLGTILLLKGDAAQGVPYHAAGARSGQRSARKR